MATKKSCNPSSKKVVDPKQPKPQDLDRKEAEQDDYMPKENNKSHSCDD